MRFSRLAAALGALVVSLSANATSFSENFDNVAALAGTGWLQTNLSTVPGAPWQQGNTAVFTSQTGGADSYVEASFASLNSASGTVANWLISPVLTLDAGSVLSFWTKSTSADEGFADVLSIYYSAGSSSTANFTLLSVVGGGTSGLYPSDWTHYAVNLPITGAGRFAFVQGGTAATADYLGIDTVSVTSPSAVPEPSTYALMALGIGAIGLVRRRRR